MFSLTNHFSTGPLRSRLALPLEDLSLAARRRIAEMTPVDARADWDLESKLPEMLGVDAQKGRLVVAGIGERRQDRDRQQRHDRAAFHPGPRAHLGPPPEHDRPPFHLQPPQTAAPPPNGNGSPSHARADFAH